MKLQLFNSHRNYNQRGRFFPMVGGVEGGGGSERLKVRGRISLIKKSDEGRSTCEESRISSLHFNTIFGEDEDDDNKDDTRPCANEITLTLRVRNSPKVISLT